MSNPVDESAGIPPAERVGTLSGETPGGVSKALPGTRTSDPIGGSLNDVPPQSSREGGRESLRTLKVILTSPRGALSALVLLFVIGCALFAPLIAPYAYDIQALSISNVAPSSALLMGTDEFGRDLWSRIVYGARTSLSVALVSIAISVVAGLSLGASAAYFGGLFDRIVTATVNLTWSFPEILIALMLIAIIGPGTQSVMIAISIAYLAQFTRLTRAQILARKGETYVEVTRNLGAGHAHVIFRHVLPNALTPVIVAGMLATGDAIILKATLASSASERNRPFQAGAR